MIHCSKCVRHWRISKFFQIHAVWWKNWQNRVLEPSGGFAHPPGEILEPPLHCLSHWANLAGESYGIFEVSFVHAPLHFLDSDDSPRMNRVWLCKGIDTPSVKLQRKDPIEIYCDAPKSVPDPFPSVTLYTMDPMGSNLTLDAWRSVCLQLKDLKVFDLKSDCWVVSNS